MATTSFESTSAPVPPFRSLGELCSIAEVVFDAFASPRVGGAAGLDVARFRFATRVLFGANVDESAITGAFASCGRVEDTLGCRALCMDREQFRSWCCDYGVVWALGCDAAWVLWDAVDPRCRGYITTETVGVLATQAARYFPDSLSEGELAAAVEWVRSLEGITGSGRVVGSDWRSQLFRAAGSSAV